MLVFDFGDGCKLPIYDGDLDEIANAALTTAVETERRQRAKAGQSSAGIIRELTPDEQIPQAPAKAGVA